MVDLNAMTAKGYMEYLMSLRHPRHGGLLGKSAYGGKLVLFAQSLRVSGGFLFAAWESIQGFFDSYLDSAEHVVLQWAIWQRTIHQCR